MSVLEDENAIAVRLREIQQQRATAMGINLPPTFGKLAKPPQKSRFTDAERLGALFFEDGKSTWYGIHGGYQVNALSDLMEKVARLGINHIYLEGRALDRESGLDCLATPIGLAKLRQEYVAENMVKAMLFTGMVTLSSVSEDSLAKEVPPGNRGEFRRVNIYRAD